MELRVTIAAALIALAAILHFVYAATHRSDTGMAVIFVVIGIVQAALVAGLVMGVSKAVPASIAVNVGLVILFVVARAVGPKAGITLETITALTILRKACEIVSVLLLIGLPKKG